MQVYKEYSEVNIEKLDILIEYLGDNYKKIHNEYVWQCPLCAKEGADRHHDNLKYNISKGFLTCFRDPTHSYELRKELFAGLYRSGRENIQGCSDNLCQMESTMSDEKRIELILKFNQYTDDFLKDKTEHKGIITQLETVRGLTFDTARDVGLGIKITRPDYCNNYGYMWAIPTIKYSTTEDEIANLIMGFEYRPPDFSKDGLKREANCGTGLAMVNAFAEDTEILMILEGYLDCYAFWQHIKTLKQDKYYHIVTPCNGVNSLVKQIDEVDFTKYKKWILFLDNDSAGRTVAGAIKEKYPFFTDYYLSCGCKDFNEHLLKCIAEKNKLDKTKGGKNE